MKRREFLQHLTLGITAATLNACARASSAPAAKRPARPNMVYILADDMGYGDLGCLNKDGKIPTPHMDRLAAQGQIFTDAHSGSAVCTPTRYGILTGRYCWRSRLKEGVLWGYSPPLIQPGRLTAAAHLKQGGYRTACVGKWHLGLGWASTDSRKAQEGNVDYSKRIAGGPVDLGFDYFYGIPASLDMDPYVYVENDRVEAPPSEHTDGRKGKAFYRPGPAAPGFRHEEVLPRLTEKAVACIDRHAESDAGAPLFLYFPLPAPHTPILPTQEFQGKSGIGDYGDFVCQVDWTVGQVMQALERNGMAENTLVVLTSDNGCSPMAAFPELEQQGHHPSYRFRGHKADIFEGGHRIPFIVRWPGHVKPGSHCNDTVCLTDFMATAADIAGGTLPDNAAEDSVSLMPLLLGTASGPVREATVHHSINGSFAIRQGNWKLELCPGSGGWSAPKPDKARKLGLPPVQLYDLRQDIGERKNLQDQHPEVVQRLTALLQQYIENGRSTPGPPQQNEGKTSIWGPRGR